MAFSGYGFTQIIDLIDLLCGAMFGEVDACLYARQEAFMLGVIGIIGYHLCYALVEFFLL